MAVKNNYHCQIELQSCVTELTPDSKPWLSHVCMYVPPSVGSIITASPVEYVAIYCSVSDLHWLFLFNKFMSYMSYHLFPLSFSSHLH